MALGLSDEHLPDARVALADDEWDIALGDPRLLAGDGGEVGPQVLGVLAGDLRHYAHERRDDVRGVEPASHTDLDNADMDAPGGEVGEGERGRRLEEARVELLDVGLQVARPLGKGVLVNRHPVNDAALANGNEVR